MIYDEQCIEPDIFALLRYDAVNTVYEMFKEICREDNRVCIYRADDFKAKIFKEAIRSKL